MNTRLITLWFKGAVGHIRQFCTELSDMRRYSHLKPQSLVRIPVSASNGKNQKS